MRRRRATGPIRQRRASRPKTKWRLALLLWRSLACALAPPPPPPPIMPELAGREACATPQLAVYRKTGPQSNVCASRRRYHDPSHTKKVCASRRRSPKNGGLRRPAQAKELLWVNAANNLQRTMLPDLSCSSSVSPPKSKKVQIAPRWT